MNPLPLKGYAAAGLPAEGMLLVFMSSKCGHWPICKKITRKPS